MNANHSRHFVIGLICIFAGLGTKTAAAQAAVAPCSLLNSGQVTAAIGATVGEGKPIADTGCSWTSATPHIVVTVSLWDGAKWDRMKAPLPGATKTPVSGVGDDAIFTAMGPNAEFTTLSVKKGATVYTLKVYGVDAPKQRSAEQALAGNLVGNLH